ncbi:MAG: GTP cyclohydrolase [Flavobacteriaceae bacterium]|nr:GTP cyclohydrolase [Flavobacteriaceae bacterium]
MYIINFKFIKEIEEINKFTIAHREYVSKQYDKGIFTIGGPKNPRDGGIVIADINSKKKLIEILEGDPFIVNKLAQYSLTEFTPLMSTSKLDYLLK